MVVSIANWMDGVLAGHVLAVADHEIVRARGMLRPYKDKVAYLEKWHQNLRQELQRLKTGKNIRIHLGMNPTRNFMGIKKIKGVLESEGEVVYLVAKTARGKRLVFGERYDYRVKKYQLDEAVTFFQKLLDGEIRHYNRGVKLFEAGGDQETDGPKLVELSLLRRECLKYTTNAKHYKSKTKRVFPIDLTGWKYADPNGPLIQKVRKQLEGEVLMIRIWVETTEEAEAFIPVLERKLRSGEYPPQETGDGAAGHRRKLVEAMATDKSFPKNVNPYKVISGWKARKTPDYEDFPFGNTFMTLEAGREELKKREKDLERVVTPEVALKSRAWGQWDEITASLDFKGHLTRGGVWMPGKRMLEVDIRADHIWTVKEFRGALARVHDILWHELQHVGQDVLRELQLMSEDAGLPAKKIRDPNYEISGYPQGRPRGQGRRKHEMREVEFHTDLSEAIRGFLRSLNNIPKKEWRERLEQFVAIKDNGHRTDSWFKTWKRESPEKWKKAVAEFVKEVESRVDIPGASNIRRIGTMHRRDLEQLATRIERLMRVRTHGWDNADLLDFKNRLPNSRVRDPRRKLPDPVKLRELAKQDEHSDEDEKWVSHNWRMWIQTAMTMEGLIRDNDPRNPRRIIRDVMRGQYPR